MTERELTAHEVKHGFQNEGGRLIGWLLGQKRYSNNTGETYLTKKDRRMADRPFLNPRSRVRKYEGARRAKSMKYDSEV